MPYSSVLSPQDSEHLYCPSKIRTVWLFFQVRPVPDSFSKLSPGCLHTCPVSPAFRRGQAGTTGAVRGDRNTGREEVGSSSRHRDQTLAVRQMRCVRVRLSGLRAEGRNEPRATGRCRSGTQCPHSWADPLRTRLDERPALQAQAMAPRHGAVGARVTRLRRTRHGLHSRARGGTGPYVSPCELSGAPRAPWCAPRGAEGGTGLRSCIRCDPAPF